MFYEPQTGDYYCRHWGAIEGSRLKYNTKQCFKNVKEYLERNPPELGMLGRWVFHTQGGTLLVAVEMGIKGTGVRKIINND